MTSTMTRPSTQTTTTTTTREAPGRTVSVVGICLGAVAIILNIFTGIPGLICGVVGAAKGNRLGWVAIAVSIICTGLNFALGQMVVHLGH